MTVKATGDATPPREFNCIDCGAEVVTIGLTYVNDNDVCLICQWLRRIDDPVERDVLRRLLRPDVP